jgi:hypothetical protein
MTEGEVIDRLVEFLNVLLAGISVFFTIVSAYIAGMHYFLRKEAFLGRIAAFGFFLFMMALLIVVMSGAIELHAGLIARLREIDAAGELTAAGRAALANAQDAKGTGYSLDGVVNLALLVGVALTIMGLFVLTFMAPVEPEDETPRHPAKSPKSAEPAS